MSDFQLGPIQKKWLEALRSGKYKQGKGFLNQGNEKFCCLGVLCEVMGFQKKETETGAGRFAYSEDGVVWSVDVLPTLKILDLCGLLSNTGHPKEGRGLEDLTILNDKNGKTFEQIADIIEENADAYFKEPR